MSPPDTIAAMSSAAGPAGRMIVRASGPDAGQIAAAVAEVVPVDGGRAVRTTFRFAGMAVPGWLYVFRRPRSYTGEDLVEFHIPGNPLLARMLLDAVVGLGARPAEAGEFTARAYFNGRLDLTGAEGVAATIAAHSEQELAAARQLMAGELARRLRPAMDAVAETLALVEVGIDFVDEDVTVLTPAEAVGRIGAAADSLRRLLAESTRFERLAHEPQFVLVGRPNAGKSTLLNALAGRPRAVTSPVAGTTRDALTAEVVLRRGVVRVTDVAGVESKDEGGRMKDEGRQSGPSSDSSFIPHPSSLSSRMREQALRAAEGADVVVLVQDVTDARPPPRLHRPADLVVRTKADLSGPADGSLRVSAATGENLDKLREALDRLAFGAAGSPGAGGGAALALNARHLAAVNEAVAALDRAAGRGGGGEPAEVVALELRDALDALGGVLGHVSPDDLLGRIFSSFCIGK